MPRGNATGSGARRKSKFNYRPVPKRRASGVVGKPPIKKKKSK